MTNPNEPANPTMGWEEIGDRGEKLSVTDMPGLSKREYFAAMVLQGMLACGGYDTTLLPQGAVNIADNLIVELNKGKEVAL